MSIDDMHACYSALVGCNGADVLLVRDAESRWWEVEQ
jgi:hypothetical protein